jgi:hypothetical protein
MTKNYFELDKVESITLTHERETRYQWYPTIPSRTRTFMGIKFGKDPEIEEGWNRYTNDDGTEKYQWDRSSTEYIKSCSWYRLDESNKKIYHRAHVTIYLSYKHSLGMNFDSTEEAQAYVDELISSSDKQFHVIINK